MTEAEPKSRPVVQPLLSISEETHIERHPTLWVFLTDDEEAVRHYIESGERPVLIATSRERLKERYEDTAAGLRFFLTRYAVGSGFNGLLQVRDILLSAYFDGAIGSDDRVLVIAETEASWHARLYYDLTKEHSIARLKRELEYAAPIEVIESVLHIAAEIAREGREAGHVGAIFVLGDTERVLANSRQLVLNPFLGHPVEVRNIKDESTWETAKEFAQIDGAFIIDEAGVIHSAGRYIDVKSPVNLPSGLGGRHLASAAITKETKAVAVTVSETGVIRIFKDGEILMRIGTT